MVANRKREPQHRAALLRLSVLVMELALPASMAAQVPGACASPLVTAGAQSIADDVVAFPQIHLHREGSGTLSFSKDSVWIPAIDAKLFHYRRFGPPVGGMLLLERNGLCFELGGFAFPMLPELARTLGPPKSSRQRAVRACLMGMLVWPDVGVWEEALQSHSDSALLQNCEPITERGTRIRGRMVHVVIFELTQLGTATFRTAVVFDESGGYLALSRRVVP